MVENPLLGDERPHKMTTVNVLLWYDNTQCNDFASLKRQFFLLAGFIVLLLLTETLLNISLVIICKSYQCPLADPYWQTDVIGGFLNVFSVASFLRCFHVLGRDFLKCPKLKSPWAHQQSSENVKNRQRQVRRYRYNFTAYEFLLSHGTIPLRKDCLSLGRCMRRRVRVCRESLSISVRSTTCHIKRNSYTNLLMDHCLIALWCFSRKRE